MDFPLSNYHQIDNSTFLAASLNDQADPRQHRLLGAIAYGVRLLNLYTSPEAIIMNLMRRVMTE
jgi:hypothetical protein